jgi:hypothetical protein
MYTCPPEGCDISERDGKVLARATTHSWRVVPAAGFALFWNCIVLVFAAGVISGKVPWFVLILMSGHIGVGVYLIAVVCMYAAGDVEVSIDGQCITVSTGVAKIRRSRRRELGEVREVRVETKYGRRGSNTTELVLDGPKPLKFGGFLNDERRGFLHAVVAAEVYKRGMQRRIDR